MVQLKEMNEFVVEDMKVFKTDDMQWVAAPTLLHALAFLEEQIGELGIEEIGEVEKSDLKNDGMWDAYSVSDEEKIDYENGKIKLANPKKIKLGDYGIFADVLCKYTSFENVIKREGVGAYIIACTEY